MKILDEKILQQSEAVEKSSSAVEEINTNIAAANEAIAHISNEYAVIVKETEDGRAKQNEVTKQERDSALYQMKDNTIAVVSQIEELKESSQTILSSGNNANEQLIKMDEFASVTTTQAAQNADLTASVDEIVSSYKVEA